LDDAADAKLLRAAADQPRLLVRVTVEVLLRTGTGVGKGGQAPDSPATADCFGACGRLLGIAG
jgi:hypothetical protein